jgi:hypothetical protein
MSDSVTRSKDQNNYRKIENEDHDHEVLDENKDSIGK